MFRTTIIFLILPALAAWPLWAQLQIGVIRGKVTGQDGTPLEGALVNLRDPRGSLLVSTQSGVNGEFVLTGIAPGSYMLAAATSQLRSLSHPIAVRSALPTEVELWLRAPIADELVVTSSGEVSLAATRISLAGEAVRSAPERLRSRGIQAAVATAPGWATEDNGIVHVRGVDDGFLYVIDGVPVYDRLDKRRNRTHYQVSMILRLSTANENLVLERHLWTSMPGTVPHSGTRGFPILGARKMRALPGVRS